LRRQGGWGYHEEIQRYIMRIGGASRLAKTALVLLCAQEAAAWVGPLGKGRLASTRGRAGGALFDD
jgi:hypothetical protein